MNEIINIDQCVESLKVIFYRWLVANKRQIDYVDSLDHEAKAISEIVNDWDIYSASI